MKPFKRTLSVILSVVMMLQMGFTTVMAQAQEPPVAENAITEEAVPETLPTAALADEDTEMPDAGPGTAGIDLSITPDIPSPGEPEPWDAGRH